MGIGLIDVSTVDIWAPAFVACSDCHALPGNLCSAPRWEFLPPPRYHQARLTHPDLDPDIARVLRALLVNRL